jgi:protein-tyrosine phosphatase
VSDPPATQTPLWIRVRRETRLALQRLLHPIRRRAALARLQRLGALDRILVVCYANVNRSPYAAALLRRDLAAEGLPITVEQGGFFGPGRSPPELAKNLAMTRGIDLREHRSRFVTKDDTVGPTLVIVMEDWHAVRVRRSFGTPGDRLLMLGDLDPGPITSRSITDPVGGSPETFAEVYDRIDRCVAELLRGLSGGRSRAVKGEK